MYVIHGVLCGSLQYLFCWVWRNRYISILNRKMVYEVVVATVIDSQILIYKVRYII